MFESLCCRDMRVYAQVNASDIYLYRDKNELEADMVIALRDGRWAQVEVNLGQKQIEEATAHLIKLSEKIDSEKMGRPSFMMVLTAG